MPPVCRPMHGINLCKMAFEVSSGLHSYSRESFGVVERDLSHWISRSISNPPTAGKSIMHRDMVVLIDLQLVSARSSFLRLILSFRPSASLLAAVILACICSPVKSFDMVPIGGPLRTRSGGSTQVIRACDLGLLERCAGKNCGGSDVERTMGVGEAQELKRCRYQGWANCRGPQCGNQESRGGRRWVRNGDERMTLSEVAEKR